MEQNNLKEFYYRVNQKQTILDVCKLFDVEEENITRNNNSIPLYVGEVLKISPNDYVKYIVKPTETLKDVATKFGVTATKIIEDNKLKTSKLFIGQVLKIY